MQIINILKNPSFLGQFFDQSIQFHPRPRAGTLASWGSSLSGPGDGPMSSRRRRPCASRYCNQSGKEFLGEDAIWDCHHQSAWAFCILFFIRTKYFLRSYWPKLPIPKQWKLPNCITTRHFGVQFFQPRPGVVIRQACPSSAIQRRFVPRTTEYCPFTPKSPNRLF